MGTWLCHKMSYLYKNNVNCYATRKAMSTGDKQKCNHD